MHQGDREDLSSPYEDPSDCTFYRSNSSSGRIQLMPFQEAFGFILVVWGLVSSGNRKSKYSQLSLWQHFLIGTVTIVAYNFATMLSPASLGLISSLCHPLKMLRLIFNSDFCLLLRYHSSEESKSLGFHCCHLSP